VLIAAATEDEAWARLARRERNTAEALQALGWQIPSHPRGFRH
jgi:hypothetical protein